MADISAVIEFAPDILGGIPVFKGTRVPIEALIDYLESGDGLEEFWDDFPTVSVEQARIVMELLGDPSFVGSLEGMRGLKVEESNADAFDAKSYKEFREHLEP